MTRTHSSAGFGLVELMVSITLGLLLTAAVVQTFIAANTTFRIQDSLARVQETSRYAVHFLGRDLRMTGYMGCASLSTVTVNTLSNNPPADVTFTPATVIQGVNNVVAGNTLNAVVGTDTVTIKRATSLSASLIGTMSGTNAALEVATNPAGLVAGDFAFVSDCLNADLFTVTAVGTNAGNVTLAHTTASAANTSADVSKLYGPDAEVLGFESVTYFIRDTGRDTDNGNNIHALYSLRRTAGSGGTAPTAYELVEGVENMQLRYGEDTNDDDSVDVYVDAANVTNWQNVISVQVDLLIVSEQDNIVAKTGSDNAQTVTFNGAAVNNTDGRYRRAVSYVFAIRNNLP